MNYQAHFKKGHAALESGQDFKLQKSEENLKRDKVSIFIMKFWRFFKGSPPPGLYNIKSDFDIGKPGSS